MDSTQTRCTSCKGKGHYMDTTYDRTGEDMECSKCHGSGIAPEHMAAELARLQEGWQTANMATLTKGLLNDVLELEITALGNAATDVFEQMTLGNWRDDHGHDVRMNQKFQDLALAVSTTVNRRALMPEFNPLPQSPSC